MNTNCRVRPRNNRISRSICAGVKAIHCEKPMAPTWGESLKMAAACDKAGIQLTFGHQRRFLDAFRKAKELGMQPRSLIKNIPSPSQQWKVPVREWVRSLHAKKFGVQAAAVPPANPPVSTAAELVVPTVAAQPVARPQAAEPQRVVEFRNREHPWPDRPQVPDLIVDLNDDFDESWERRGPPDESDIAETTSRMIRRQYLYRWGAQSVAIAMSRLPEVRKVAAFGAIAQPLRMQVPRFGQYRRYRIEVPHECADVDLAVWLDDFSRLKELKRALAEGLRPLQDTPYGGIAHHQVDLHVFDAAGSLYRGRVCIFGQCPKPGKRECRVPNCGDKPFLQQIDDYRLLHRIAELLPDHQLPVGHSGFQCA